MGLHANLLSQEEVRLILQEVLEQENLIGADIEVSSGAIKGDGFLSSVNKVKISGNGKKLLLVIKSAPASKEFRKVVPLNELFAREIYFYDKVYPILKEFQILRRIQSPFSSIVKCYLTNKNEFNERIVLENIQDDAGFEMWDKREQFDEAHITTIFKLYGKFHATSFALQDQNPEQFDALTKNLTGMLSKFSADFFIQFKESIAKSKNIFDENEKSYIDALNRLVDDVEPFLRKIENEKTKFSVITHGDCWSNNMMFKYENGIQNIVDIKLLDFQLMQRGSPVMDLCYCLYASAKKDIYDNLDFYLNIYYDSLSNHMSKLGSTAQKLYPFTALQQDWKDYSRFGLIMAHNSIRAALLEPDEVIDIMDLAETGDGVVKSMRAEKVVNKRLRDLIEHFVKHCYL